MSNTKGKAVLESDVPFRRRGRPTGKNRIPLSREERRARNAQYERERRNESAEVMSQLIDAVNCDPNISNADLLATVISRIQRATEEHEDISDLERINANLEAQIATLSNRLGFDDASLQLLEDENNDLESIEPQSNLGTSTNTHHKRGDHNTRKQKKKRKRSECSSSEIIKQEKRTKTQSETCSVDSGIEMRNVTVSPPACRVEDNMQYTIKNEQQQLPVEITEEHDHNVSEAHMILQTELYNQIYNSESQNNVQSLPGWDAVESLPTQSIPCMETLARSLIVVPPIVPPPQDPPNLGVQHQTVPELTNLENVELPCDMNFKNECDFLPVHIDTQPTLDFLTDPEKVLLTELIGADFLETSGFGDQTQMPVRNYTIDDMLSRYW